MTGKVPVTDCLSWSYFLLVPQVQQQFHISSVPEGTAWAPSPSPQRPQQPRPPNGPLIFLQPCSPSPFLSSLLYPRSLSPTAAQITPRVNLNLSLPGLWGAIASIQTSGSSPIQVLNNLFKFTCPSGFLSVLVSPPLHHQSVCLCCMWIIDFPSTPRLLPL